MINLGYNKQYIQSYVELRNQFIEELMTQKITVEGTKDWLSNDNGKIHCLIEDERVIAAVIVRKRREVTVFSDRSGMGDMLLREADKMAYEMGFDRVWAKIHLKNDKSIKLFERSGYNHEGRFYLKHIHYGETFGLRKGAETFPMMVITAMLYVCNSRCPACPYTSNPEIRKLHKDAMYISDKIFKKLADECGVHGTLLRLCGGGEPFLHKNLIPLVRYAKDAGCKVSIITNGSIDVCEAVNVVDMIEFSVDAGIKEEYEKVRVGLDWNTLNKNIGYAIKKRKTTEIICSIINQQGIDVERAKKYWDFLDAVQVRKFLTFMGDVKNNSADEAPFLPPEKRLPCPWLFDRICMNTHGDFTYCGADIRCKYKIANIMDRSVQDVWQGKEYSEIRALHLERKGGMAEMCRDCPDWKYRTWDYSFWKLKDYAEKNRSNTTA